MTMSVDKDLIAAGFSAAEMGVEKYRQVHAKLYSDKFSAFASFEATFVISSDIESAEHKICELWTHCVVGDRRWEVRAAFSVMVAKVALKAASTTDEATSKAAKDFMLWCLKGDGEEGSQKTEPGGDMHKTHDTDNTHHAEIENTQLRHYEPPHDTRYPTHETITLNAAHDTQRTGAESDEGDDSGESFGGLLSLMAHGDPKNAKGRKVESLAMSLSMWSVLPETAKPYLRYTNA